ncbi:MAG: hypothetical protein A2508_02460 [Candidatus Lambdaproteobacteria bacterium RIFOXYD12_FULL_49_8]|nr:MAG: hypothetical protein A2508_02460 [Candidatus Lambdaproteobacteria bacterium RIFOXYD12_FULL_49_8]
MAQLIKPFLIRNPGCEFCKNFLESFEYKGEQSKSACLIGAQKIFQQGLPFMERRKYKWIGCGYATEKNRDRYCEDFQVYSLTGRLAARLILFFQRSGEQLPPSFGGEKWWNN